MPDSPAFTSQLGALAQLPPVRGYRPLAAAWGERDTRIDNLVRVALVLATCAVLSFLLWASLTEVAEVTVAPGEIAPTDMVRVVQHLEGGIIAELLARPGQRVEAGQMLMRLDAAVALAERQRLTARRSSVERETRRLVAFANDESPDRSIGPDRPVVMDDADNTQAQLLVAQLEARWTSLGAIAAQIGTRRAELDSAYAGVELADRQVALLTEEMTMREDLKRQQLNSRLLVIKAELQLRTAEAERRRLQGMVDSLAGQIAELEARAADQRAQLRRDALERLATAQRDLDETVETLAGFDDRLARLNVRAPLAGIVQDLPNASLGAVIEPGGIVARIVPERAPLLAETRVAPGDIGFLEPGQPARVKVTAFDHTRYGIIAGVVDRISPATFKDERGQPYFTMRIALLPPDGALRNHLLMPGMTVQADVTTGSKTILQYLLKPLYATAEGAFHER